MAKQFSVLKKKELLVDQTKASTGGDYTPPAEGLARARLIAYVEVGKHEKVSKQYGTKVQSMVHLTFELSGPKWEPKKLDDGTLIPQRITLKENLSTNTKARFYKLFLKLRDGREDITHFAEMLGEACLIRIKHREYEVDAGGKKEKRIAVDVYSPDSGWSITPPYILKDIMDDNDEPTGEQEKKHVTISDPLSDLRLFIWDCADKEQWDSLYIEPGDGDRSKNVFQELIVNAKNFIGSPAEAAAHGSESLEAILKGGKGSTESATGDDDDDGSEGSVEDKSSKKATSAVKKVVKKKVEPETTDDEDLLADID